METLQRDALSTKGMAVQRVLQHDAEDHIRRHSIGWDLLEQQVFEG